MEKLSKFDILLIILMIVMISCKKEKVTLTNIYNPGDVAVINSLIANNGLDWTPSPADGSSVNASWKWSGEKSNFGVAWSKNVDNKRITRLAIANKRLTGATDLSALTKLKELECWHNSLTNLDISGCAELTTLLCGNNVLTDLDVSNNTALVELRCEENSLTNLDVSNNAALRILFCSNNELTDLDIRGCAALQQLMCQNNKLVATTLDDISNALPERTGRGAGEIIISNNPGTAAANKDIATGKNWKITPLTPGFYNPGDVAVINSLIAKNGLDWTPSPADGSTVYPSWKWNGEIMKSGVAWSEDADNKRITRLAIANNRLTGAADLSSLTKLKDLECWHNSLTKLDISGCAELNTLVCGNNVLTDLDVSNNTALVELSCDENSLTNLDVSNNAALRNLFCFNNKLNYLDISGCVALQLLLCQNNRLTATTLDDILNALPERTGSGAGEIIISNNPGTATANKDIATGKNWKITPLPPGTYNPDDIAVINALITNMGLDYMTRSPKDGSMVHESWSAIRWSEAIYNKRIIWLDLFNCRLIGVADFSALTELKGLRCNDNSLTGLNISGCSALEFLECSKNSLSVLDVSGLTKLKSLHCGNNDLTVLDVTGCTALTVLWCYNNNLSELDVSNNVALGLLSCGNNSLSTLNVSNNTVLYNLSCQNNNLSELDVSNNLELEWIDCGNNNFEDTALDAIFKALPYWTGTWSDAEINIRNNPGTDTCNKDIATSKNWYVTN